MASLTAIAIGFALVADFLLLPTLLIAIDRRRRPTLNIEPRSSSTSPDWIVHSNPGWNSNGANSGTTWS
jgi:hypothetical protein